VTEVLGPTTTTTNVTITGDVSGQVAIGNNIVQIGQVAAGARIDIALPQAIVPPRRRPPPCLLLPRPFPDLLGREQEIGAASGALLAARPVELSGESGMGKTALLRHLAHRLDAGRFPGGLVYLSGRDLVLGDLLQSVFETFYECTQPHKATDAELRESLKDLEALVLLDDVGVPRDHLESLLDLAPRSVFLCADEQPVLYGERQPVALKGLATEPALRLIERELGRPLTAAETEPARALCAAVAGHPLRLLQAAARTRTENGAFGSEEPAAPPDERSRAVLGALALVGAPLTPAQISALAGIDEVRPVLDGLAERELVRAEGRRYELAVPAATAPLSDAEAGAVLDRALAHFSAPPLAGGMDPAEIPGSSEAIVRVLEQAAARHRWADVLRVAHRVEGPLALAPRWGSWDRVLAKAAEAATAVGDRKELAWALHQSGTRALALGAAPAARASLERALEIREALGDTTGAELTRHNLGLLVPPPPPQPPHPPWKPLAIKLGLAAVGLAAGAVIWLLLPHPAVTIPAAVRFEPQAVGSRSTTETVSFFNRAGRVVEGLRLTVEGPQAAEFTIPVDKCSRARLQPAGACAVSVQFRPAHGGPRAATLAIASPDGRELASVPLSGTATVPLGPGPGPHPPAHPVSRMVAGSPSLTFGETTIGETSTATVSLSNRGTASFQATRLRLQGSQASEFRIVHENCAGRALAPAVSCTLELGFLPARAGRRTARLVLDGDGAGATVRLSGNGRPPLVPPVPPVAPGRAVAIAQVEPDRLEFGAGTVDSSSAPHAIVIRNSGTAPLTLESATVAGPDQGSFAVAEACAASLDPDRTCALEVRFTPRRAGDHAATLSLAFGAGLPPRQVALSGSATKPPGPVTRTEPSALDFGTQDLKNHGDPLPVRIINGGPAPLGIGKISVADADAGGHDRHNFHVKNQCSNKPIAPGAACEISVQFTPTGLGAHPATLTIVNDAPDGPLQVTLTGTAEGGQLAVNPASLGFSGTAGGRSEPQTLTLTNGGTKSLALSKVSISGGGFAGAFGQGESREFAIVSNDCGPTLDPTQSCAVAVSFTPQKVGSANGKLNAFADGAAVPSVQADLNGTSAAGELASPRPIGPGSFDANSPPAACGQSTALAWTAVAGNGMGYLVRLEEDTTPLGTGTWRTTKVLIEDGTPSPGTQRDVSDITHHNGSFRWSVRARDAAGNESAPSQALYFVCNIVL
jgi:hypothetical protein